MTDPTAQLRAIRICLQGHDLHLCRLGSHQEWVALGLRHSPTLRYSKGRWECSTTELQALVHQAIGNQHHDHRNRPSKSPRRRTA